MVLSTALHSRSRATQGGGGGTGELVVPGARLARVFAGPGLVRGGARGVGGSG